ncbi:hypothetical protein DTO164E3_5368 [Paecilomyces variotii]|uniref:BTB/POZ domain protein n=1 Tax=Byssochlamys spectabilis TaxID=264951 RepID=A0A443HR13_BYSSP|nr:BTB/POZ domain protein [Paecilomyces variotii]KAJ9194390.1 hypothetical protein DTO032I3_7408 [Paecilomyces variotii]KAJ9198112.1 hypothetical protein DTO164E3_5368 [Paecilomyces variotii]KAJ9222399.1 hypothetical protein DTO169C6_5334 [Paecilomyces variotii]KAJ9281218.1 hypothetical protein DTO021D3_1877 [Paecilomyces variotii]KAJ9324787.1 hypothetical protein DTO027B3_4249 [Paecilomyces variotii]
MANDQLEVAEVKAETADDDGHVGELIASFQSFFASSTFSDLTIVTKDQEFKVHKLIVCSQSGFFARLFKQNWKEAEENVVRLNEDDPRAVEAMVHFMYGFNYNNSGSEHGRVSPMLLNVKVYQVADKYDIPKLKAQAKENFTVAINKCWEMDDFPTAIEDAYSTTTSADRGLRDPLVSLSLEHIDILLDNEDFKQALRNTLGFAADLVQRNAKGKLYLCPCCTNEFYVGASSSFRYCPLCSLESTDWEKHAK